MRRTKNYGRTTYADMLLEFSKTDFYPIRFEIRLQMAQLIFDMIA